MEMLKRIYWDLKFKHGRNQFVEHFLRSLPLSFGMYMREQWYSKHFKSCGINLHVLPGTYILHPERVECGDNVFLGINNYIQAAGGLVLGSDVMFGPYVKIWTQNHIFEDYDTPVWKQGYEYKPVVIGNDVWLGANVFVMPGAIIGNNCIISANSVIAAKNYPDGCIMAGYPARKIGERNKI